MIPTIFVIRCPDYKIFHKTCFQRWRLKLTLLHPTNLDLHSQDTYQNKTNFCSKFIKKNPGFGLYWEYFNFDRRICIAQVERGVRFSFYSRKEIFHLIFTLRQFYTYILWKSTSLKRKYIIEKKMQNLHVLRIHFHYVRISGLFWIWKSINFLNRCYGQKCFIYLI